LEQVELVEQVELQVHQAYKEVLQVFQQLHQQEVEVVEFFWMYRCQQEVQGEVRRRIN
jgi:hypothetical protein